ncbi:hypothetical protein [Methylobacterium fujisawaense]
MKAATHPAHVEGVTPRQAAQRLYDTGRRFASLPFGNRMLAIEIVRAFEGANVRFGDTLASGEAMQAVRYELQRICTAAIANPFDPEHLDAVKAESARFARQAGRASNTETQQ